MRLRILTFFRKARLWVKKENEMTNDVEIENNSVAVHVSGAAARGLGEPNSTMHAVLEKHVQDMVLRAPR